MLIFGVGLLVVVAALAVPLFVLVRAVALAVRRGQPVWRALFTPGPLCAVGVLALVGAGATALVGWASGFYVLDPDEMCASSAGFYSGTPGPSDASWTGIDRSVFPVRQTCTWADGTTYELVPGWVDAALVIFLLVALAAFVEAVVRAAGRPRRDPADVPTAGVPMR